MLFLCSIASQTRIAAVVTLDVDWQAIANQKGGSYAGATVVSPKVSSRVMDMLSVVASESWSEAI